MEACIRFERCGRRRMEDIQNAVLAMERNRNKGTIEANFSLDNVA